MIVPNKNLPKVSLVGAGPGDPELITLKAVKALESADAVLYDALVNEQLLDYAPKSVVRLFVGKRAGRHSYKQEEINRLIVEHAYSFGHVVRLKGGDPFIFGRGQEEMDYVKSFGIEVCVVPGISSAHSVPAINSIPLTARGMSDSFWVITGTTSGGKVSNDLFYAAQSNATVIVLMGMNKLKEIMGIFSRFHKDETPVAIIQNGSLPNQKMGFGTVSTIAAVAREKRLGSPAIIVIGEVVKVAQNDELMATILEQLEKKA